MTARRDFITAYRRAVDTEAVSVIACQGADDALAIRSVHNAQRAIVEALAIPATTSTEVALKAALVLHNLRHGTPVFFDDGGRERLQDEARRIAESELTAI